MLGILLLLPALYKGNSIIGMAIIAYSLGLRHAFDSDHIVAIDNTVRKLIEKVKLTGGGILLLIRTLYGSICDDCINCFNWKNGKTWNGELFNYRRYYRYNRF